MNKNSFVKLVLSILMCQLAGIIGSLFTISSIENWYQFLNKPIFSPPNWIFGPVWTTLYTLMGIAFYKIWITKSKKQLKTKAYIVFFAQLVLNTTWSIVFFGLKNPLLAFINIILILILIVFTIVIFRKVNALSAKLLYPYLLWVSFASVLNLAIVVLN